MIQLSTDLLIFKVFNIGQKQIHDFWESLHLGTFRFVLLCAVSCLIEKKACANHSKILLRE